MSLRPENDSPRPSPRRRHYSPPSHLLRRDRGDFPDPLHQHSFLAAVERFVEPSDLREPHLVSSAVGAISKLLLTIPGDSVRFAPFADRYRELLSVLPAETRFLVLTHESSLEAVQAWPEVRDRGDDVDLVTARDHLNFTDWAEDPFVIVDSQDGRAFVEPFSFLRFADSLVAESTARHAHLLVTQAPLYFQGGNLLIGDDFFLIGGDYPRRSLAYIPAVIRPAEGESDEQLIERLFQERLDSQRRMLVVESPVEVPSMKHELRRDGEGFYAEEFYAGNSPGTVQPISHIDMFISLGGRGDSGKYRLLVGDPGLAARILGVSPWPHAMQDVFDGITASLERQGFEVKRNPLPLAYWLDEVHRNELHLDEESLRELEQNGIESLPLYRWFFATSNNALVQDVEDSRRVWLPTYGHGAWGHLTATDQAHADVWRDLGFSVTQLGDFLPFAELLGAVHCVTKYLQRG